MQFNRFMESQMLVILETSIIHILGNTDLFALHKANLIYYTYPKASKEKSHPIYILQLLFSAEQTQRCSLMIFTQIIRQASSDKETMKEKHSRLKSIIIKVYLFFLIISDGSLWFPCVSPYKFII